jgi:hypothetical protein
VHVSVLTCIYDLRMLVGWQSSGQHGTNKRANDGLLRLYLQIREEHATGHEPIDGTAGALGHSYVIAPCHCSEESVVCSFVRTVLTR